MKFQAALGNTTYTIEDQPNGIVRLSRSNPSDRDAQFFVPVSLVVEYVATWMAPRIGRLLTKLGEEKS